MKYFLDSAKLDEIKLAYNTFGIDGVTTNPRHIMLSGKPFLTAITDIANWIKEEGLEGYEKFPVSVEINPHLDDTEEMIAAAKKVSAISENFVIKIPCTEAGVAAARRLEKEGIRTNVTLVFSPAQAIWPAKNGSLFVSPFLGWKEANGEDCKQYIKDIVDLAPVIIMFCFAGAFAATGNTKELIICAGILIFSYILTVLDIDNTPLMLGMILEDIMEQNFVTASMSYDRNYSIFITRPISAVILIITVVLLVSMIRVNRRVAKLNEQQEAEMAAAHAEND